MHKTEYRIIPNVTTFGDMYLQFKYTEDVKGFFGKRKKVETWRYVPNDLVAYVSGRYLSQKECPSELLDMCESDFLCSFHQQEDFEIIPFINTYPDIERYFEFLRNKRKEYLMNKDAAGNASIVYL